MKQKEVKELIIGFETGAYPKEHWTHEAHFVMALWYTYHESLSKAREFIKEGIKRYNISQGGVNTDEEGYHETITEFYIQLIAQYQQVNFDWSLDELLLHLNDQPFLEKTYPFEFYTKEVLMSKAARLGWVAPDKKDLLSLKSLVSVEL